MSDLPSNTHPLTSRMLGKEMYLVTARPARSPLITDALLKAHLERQVDLERRGIMFAAGPIYPRGSDLPDAGMFVIRASSFEEAQAIADEDPLHKAGIRTYTLHKWRINEGGVTVTINYSDQTARII